MSGSTTLYTFSIEGMEGTVNIVAYSITDAEDTLKEWLNPEVRIKLLSKDKVTLGKEYRKLNTQDLAIISPNPKGTDVWKELYQKYKLSEEENKELREYRDKIEKGNKQYFNSTVRLK